jgi:hypothetical protein
VDADADARAPSIGTSPSTFAGANDDDVDDVDDDIFGSRVRVCVVVCLPRFVR